MVKLVGVSWERWNSTVNPISVGSLGSVGVKLIENKGIWTRHLSSRRELGVTMNPTVEF